MQAHSASGAVLAGTDSGMCVLFDPRVGQEVWSAETGSQINAAAIVPAPEVRSAVTAHQDGCLRLLDLRRQATSAELASVCLDAPVTAVATDGCVAVAGTEVGMLATWYLDPAGNEAMPEHSRSHTFASAGAGQAFCQHVGGADTGRCRCIAAHLNARGDWYALLGRDGGTLDVLVCSEAG